MAPPPSVRPFIAAIVLPALFSLGLMPLFTAVRYPVQHSDHFSVEIIDADGGDVGRNLTAWVVADAAVQPNKPTYTFTTTSSTVDAAAAKAVVERGDQWAVVVALPGTSAALASAIHAVGHGGSTSYVGSSALRLYWDEGRNPTVTPQYLAAPLRTLLARFTASYAQRRARDVPAALLGNITALRPDLITAPVAVVEEIVHPSSTMPASGMLALLGNILLCVFSMSTTGLEAKVALPLAIAAHAKGSLVKAVAIRMGTLALCAATVSLAFASMVAGIGGAELATAPGLAFIQIWSLDFVLMCIFVCWFSGIASHTGNPDLVGFALVPTLL